MGENVSAVGAIGYFFVFVVALAALISSVNLAIIGKRFTTRGLLVAVTAVCVLAAMMAIGRDAARQNSIQMLRNKRAFFRMHRADFRPVEYDRLMRELDDEAARWGVK